MPHDPLRRCANGVAPAQHQIGGRFLLVFILLQPRGQFDEHAEQRRSNVFTSSTRPAFFTRPPNSMS
jgi:hypothetical protein